jgi:hypothetical protein
VPRARVPKVQRRTRRWQSRSASSQNVSPSPALQQGGALFLYVGLLLARGGIGNYQLDGLEIELPSPSTSGSENWFDL